MSKGRAEEALKTISKAIETDAGYPEAYYWRWKILISMDQVAIAEREKYLSICQSPQPRVLRKYKNTPQLCAEVAAVREYVEKDLQTREGP